jgi:hypothetical protein
MSGISRDEFFIRQLIESCRKQKKNLHMIFIDLENVYDKVTRNIMWWTIQKHKISTNYITLIKDMYDNIVTSVQTSGRDTNDFPINIELHQELTMSHYLFDLMMNDITKDIQGSTPWCMPFTDNVILVDESMTRVNQKLKLWRRTLKVKYFRLV